MNGTHIHVIFSIGLNHVMGSDKLHNYKNLKVFPAKIIIIRAEVQ